jgi:hypothetical protein
VSIRSKPVAELLDELDQELSRGRVYERTLRDPGYLTEGLCDHGTQAITIDPGVALVDVLWHELLHRRFPHWSERRVRLETHRLLTHSDRDDIGKWVRKYRKVVKKRRALTLVED